MLLRKFGERHKMGGAFMSKLYETIELLCERNQVTITEMCKDSGASRASMTDLKMGRKQNLSTQTLSKIANYFGVTVDYLLGNEQKEKPAEKSAGISDDDIKFALFGTTEIDDATLDDIKAYAKFKQEQRKG